MSFVNHKLQNVHLLKNKWIQTKTAWIQEQFLKCEKWQ